MRTIKVLAIIGLAVALVAVPALAQQKSNLAGIQAQSIDVTIKGDFVLKLGTQRYIAKTKPIPPNAVDVLVCFTAARQLRAVNWTDQQGNKIQPAVQVFVNANVTCIDVDFKIASDGSIAVSADNQRVRLTPPANAYDIEFEFTAPFTIDNAQWTDQNGAAIGLMMLDPVPTLTEWGLIALAVLLAGGMGYMIYRRRPALRPAAP